ncbi:hypothetical protein AB4094_07730 [Acidithiobacillus ferrianus]
MKQEWIASKGVKSYARVMAYTPTTLLKVPGPEQMKQEWIASKGVKSYARVMAYLKTYSRYNTKSPCARSWGCAIWKISCGCRP